MAALILSAAGAAAGSAVLGPIGAIVGRLVGAVAGSVIDRTLFGARNFSSDGPRLADLTVMASTEGSSRNEKIPCCRAKFPCSCKLIPCYIE